jgi:hypothetical protein
MPATNVNEPKRYTVDNEAARIVDMGDDSPLPFDRQAHQPACVMEENDDELEAVVQRILAYLSNSSTT